MAYSDDPTLWLYTSLSSGSSHIVTATSRLETILKANKIPFQATDVATDEKARMLWGRRAGKRKLPGLVRTGMVVADLDEVEEWNEYGEIQENLGPEKPPAPAPATSAVPSSPNAPPAPVAPTASSAKEVLTSKPSTDSAAAPSSVPQSSSDAGAKSPTGGVITPLAAAMQQIGFEVAEKANQVKKFKLRSGAAPAASATSSTKEAEPEPPQEADLGKLDNAGPTSMPPPSGEATAAEAAAPETSTAQVESKADAVPSTANEPSNTAIANEPSDTSAAATADAQGPESPLLAPASNPTESSTSTALPATGTGEIAKHRGSSISAASEQEIKEIEETTKIDQEPEEEASGEAAVDSAKDLKSANQPTETTTKPESTTVEQASAEESSAKTQESTADRTPTFEVASKDSVDTPEAVSSEPTDKAETSKTADEDLGKLTEVKVHAEQHVKFAGETPGQELDRVKAVLAGSSTLESMEKRSESDQDDSRRVTATVDDQMPATRTQDQEAADPTQAGESVAD